MSEELLRLFIAVPAPPEVREAAEATISRLRGAGDARWVTAERLHLTLKFLGDTPAAKVVDIAGALEKRANNVSRFVVSLGSVGAFPSARKPQTVWRRVTGGAEPLTLLAEEIDRTLGVLGFPRETRPFRAHLTLGRVKSGRGLGELAERLQAEQERVVPPIPWPVGEVHLVRSILRPAGPVYRILHAFPLSGEERPEQGS